MFLSEILGIQRLKGCFGKEESFTKIEMENGIRGGGFYERSAGKKKKRKEKQRWSVKVIFRPINSQDRQK